MNTGIGVANKVTGDMGSPVAPRTETTATAVDEEILVLPIVVEELHVGKQVQESGGYRIIKTVTAHEETVTEPLLRESVVVDRVAVNRLLDVGAPFPTPREEGDTLIVPLFEEVLVVEKRIRLTEELRIQRQQETVAPPPETVTLRRETVQIEPLTNGSNSAVVGQTPRT